MHTVEQILATGRFAEPRVALREIEQLLGRLSSDSDPDTVLHGLHARAVLLRLAGAPRADIVAACSMLESAAIHHSARQDAEVWRALAHALRARARLEGGESAAAMGDLAWIDLTTIADQLDGPTGFRLLDATASAFARLRMSDKVEQVRLLIEDGIATRDPVDRATHWATWSCELATRAMEPVARGAAEPDQRLMERAVQIAGLVEKLGMSAVPVPLRRTADGVRALSAAFQGRAQEALRLLGSDAFGEPEGLHPPESQLLVIAALHAHVLVGSHATARSLDDSIARSTTAIPNILLEICRARQRIWLERQSGGSPDRARQRLSDLLVRLGWTSMELATESARQAMEHQVLHAESRTDVVTGVGNRRAFDETLNALLRFTPLPVSLVLVDIDEFKQVNDEHTHVVGDEVLRTVAELISDVMPPESRLMRYGGDEFAVLLPRTGDPEARAVAETVTAAVAGYSWSEIAAGLRVRVTTGCAALWALSGRRPAADAARLFRRADEALLEAKQQAREATATSSSSGSSSGQNPLTEVLDLRDLSASASSGTRSPGNGSGGNGSRRSRRRSELIDLSDEPADHLTR